MSLPVVISTPATVDLQTDRIRPNWVIEGAPEVRSKLLAESADGMSWVAAWSCTAGRFNWYYSVDETLHIISGEVFVTDEKERKRRLGPGDMAFFPAGSHSVWHVPNEVKKLAVCRYNVPAPLGKFAVLWNRIANRFFANFGRQRLHAA